MTYRETRLGASSGELRSALLGDALFGAGSWALAEAHAAHPESATYAYEFAWRSHALDGGLGAAHAVELPFVYDDERRATMRIDTTWTQRDDPRGQERRAWRGNVSAR